MPPVRFVTLDCAETMVRVGWSPARMAAESAAAIGLTLPEAAANRYATLFAEGREAYVAANLARDLDGFWPRLVDGWLAEMGEVAQTDAFLAAADDLAYRPEAGWFSAYDDVRPTLDNLRASGVRLAVVSNWDLSLERVLSSCGLREPFDVVCASLEDGIEKPDSRIFLRAMAGLGASPEETVHVGDLLEDDVEGAEAAGMRAVLIDRTGGTPGAIRTLRELPERLGLL